MGMRRERDIPSLSFSLLWAVCVFDRVRPLFFFPLKNPQKKIFITRSIFFSTWQFLFVNFLWSRLLGRPTGNHDQQGSKGWNKQQRSTISDNHLSKTGKKKKKMGRCDLMQPKVILFFSFPKEFLIFIIVYASTILFQAMCHNISSGRNNNIPKQVIARLCCNNNRNFSLAESFFENSICT